MLKTVAILSVIVATLAGVTLWRHSGESFTFTIPNNITPKNVTNTPREVAFLKHLPFGWYSPREVASTLPSGEVIEIDLTSPNVTDWGFSQDGKSFRVDVKLSESVSQTFFFQTDKDVRNTKRASLRITKNSEKPSDAIHQQDWFWLREFYSAEVISIM